LKKIVIQSINEELSELKKIINSLENVNKTLNNQNDKYIKEFNLIKENFVEERQKFLDMIKITEKDKCHLDSN